MFSSGNGYELGATIGQSATGQSSGGTYSLESGFWVVTQTACTCQLFGDLVGAKGQLPTNCIIDVDDLLCMLDDFTDPDACLGNGDLIAAGGDCGGDGLIDVDDLLAELDAFAGIYSCPHPCPP